MEAAEEKSKELWVKCYKSVAWGYPEQTDPSTPPISSETGHISGGDMLAQWKEKKRARLTINDTDQFDRFQASEEVGDVPDILLYWAERIKHPAWAQLAGMAMEIHSIPAMSAEVERVFSR